MNILFPIDEAAPLYKVGGLGDVGGALPKGLAQLGVDVRIAIPYHPEIILAPENRVEEITFEIVYNRQTLPITVFSTLLPGTAIPVYLFYEPMYLSQHTGASDNHADKFSVFSLAVATWICRHSPYWQPHVIHCHDWHTALIPVILNHKFHALYKTIVTIHNFAYQGVTQTPVVQHLDINPADCKILSWDSADGDVNILLEGLLHCDTITTVSPSYAKEILTQEYGEKLHDIMEGRKGRIVGILNGIDTNAYDPHQDTLIPQKYSPSDWQSGKATNRAELRRQLGLSTDIDRIMIGYVGRVDPYQKGIGLMIQAIKNKALPPENCEFVFLGTGDPELERQLHQVGDNHPRVRIITRFDEALAHQIYAASHLCLIPSRFEPCGLVQLIGMRYGCLPIVRKTGGLADTVYHQQNGFVFENYSEDAMNSAISDSIKTILDSNQYATMVKSAMEGDYSWVKSAKEYAMLYQELATGKKDITNPLVDK